MQYDTKKERLSLLLKSLTRKGRLLILPHNNPDPDSLASAHAFRYLLKETLGKRADIRIAGLIGRAENREMIKQLKIPYQPVHESVFKKYDSVALLDTQPGAGNNSLPKGITPTVVIDHHAPLRGVQAHYLDIRPDYGATITIIWEYLREAGVRIEANIATAIAYAISSETQDLGREAATVDKKAYLDVFPISNLKKLSMIYHPRLTWEYFETMRNAITNTQSKRHVIYCNLGEIANPDFVHQVADLLLRVERKSWSLAMGRSDGILYFSLRTTRTKARAGKMLRRIIGKRGSAGGHDMIAGGRIEYDGLPESEVLEIEEDILQRFLRAVGVASNKSEELLDRR
ncbi:MAG: bifunctional oligoribonuclease/PAP phosphatase NrnA [Candidatus Glassbacteria bacterium]